MLSSPPICNTHSRHRSENTLGGRPLRTRIRSKNRIPTALPSRASAETATPGVGYIRSNGLREYVTTRTIRARDRPVFGVDVHSGDVRGDDPSYALVILDPVDDDDPDAPDTDEPMARVTRDVVSFRKLCRLIDRRPQTAVRRHRQRLRAGGEQKRSRGLPPIASRRHAAGAGDRRGAPGAALAGRLQTRDPVRERADEGG